MKKQLLIIALLCAGVSTMEAKVESSKDNEHAMNLKASDIKKVFAVAEKTDKAAFRNVQAVAQAHRDEDTYNDKMGVKSVNRAVSDYLRTDKGNQICERELNKSGHQVATAFESLNESSPSEMVEIAIDPRR